MPKKKKTFEEFKEEKEYIMWGKMYEMTQSLDLTQSKFESSSCDGVYWEPLLVLIYKFGNYIKATGKLKDLKMDYIRPSTYFGNNSNGELNIDGDHYVVDKTGISGASGIRMCFSNLLQDIGNYTDLDDKNFAAQYKHLQTNTVRFFKSVNAFAKEGWRIMHENVKEILEPLRKLRKSAYRLVSLEKMEKNFEDFTIFNDKNSMKEFVDKIGVFFQQEEFKSKRDADVTKLDDILGPTLDRSFYEYNYNDKIRENEDSQNSKEEEKPREKNIKRHMTRKNIDDDVTLEQKIQDEINAKININIESIKAEPPSRFMKQAMQKDFEDGIDAACLLLNRKIKDKFPFKIQAHKMFVNYECIPNGRNIPQIEYFLGDFIRYMEEMKIYLYELKLDGLARLRIPIGQNTELIEKIQKVYDIHIIIDNILGDKLLYDQYLFYYDKIDMVDKSSLKEVMEVYKDKTLIEINIPRYIVYMSLIQGATVLKKMMEYSRRDGGHYDITQYYQPTKHQIDTTDNHYFNRYEETEDTVNEEKIKTRKLYWNEINQFGRFWIAEGFFPPEDHDIWLEAIQVLAEINELVQEDIRDMILLGKSKEMKLETESKGHKNENEQLNTNEPNISNTEHKTENQLKEKKGKLYFTNCTYEGEIKNGKENGFGKLYYKDNTKGCIEFSGFFVDGKKEGKGTMLWKSGNKYVGEWKNNNMEGYGSFYYANGEKYEGERKNDYKEGQGTYYYSDGSKYVGEWKNDKKEGHAIFYWPDGEYDFGSYANDKRIGFFKRFTKSDEFIGDFKY